MVTTCVIKTCMITIKLVNRYVFGDGKTGPDFNKSWMIVKRLKRPSCREDEDKKIE